MSNKTQHPMSTALGAAVTGALLSLGTLNASENPFALKELRGGHLQMAESANAAEGKCGASMKAEEGKCGAGMKAEEGKCGAGMKAEEGKCGANMKAEEGKCGAGMKAGEGKCGAAK